jgi:hypothetical protein
MTRLMADLGIPNATLHDLRRSVGTNLTKLGVMQDIRARVLNHVDGARSVTDAVYHQHEFWAEKRAAWERWKLSYGALLTRIFVPDGISQEGEVVGGFGFSAIEVDDVRS